MKILVSAANGKTGRHIIQALRRRGDGPLIRGIGRSPAPHADEWLIGDMDDPAFRARAVEEVDTVIHYGPTMDPREIAMGTGMIDAAKAAGVPRFIFISVLHPEIDDLLNHQAKLRIEAHLINSRLDWSVLRPQHYMQNIDVARILAQGHCAQPYPTTTMLGHVDMRDLAEATAKVAMELGHSFATYDISGDEHLSVDDIAATIARVSGKPVHAVAMEPAVVIEIIRSIWRGPFADHSVEGFHRLFGYYARHGIRGNSNVLRWLLGRPARTFEDYVRGALAAM